MVYTAKSFLYVIEDYNSDQAEIFSHDVGNNEWEFIEGMHKDFCKMNRRQLNG